MVDFASFGVAPDSAAAFFQVVLIDLTLAGDNAVVIGLAAAGVPREKRGTAIAVGILAATVLRIIFALMTSTLLSIVGLLLAGGILLLWVSWKMWRELRAPHVFNQGTDVLLGEAPQTGIAKTKSLSAAIFQIVIADLSMSLDNVLAVAGAAHEHPSVLVFGLALSVMLMGFAATFIARLLERHRWIAYIGLAIIFFVAVEMIWRGGHEVWATRENLISACGAPACYISASSPLKPNPDVSSAEMSLRSSALSSGRQIENRSMTRSRSLLFHASCSIASLNTIASPYRHSLMSSPTLSAQSPGTTIGR